MGLRRHNMAHSALRLVQKCTDAPTEAATEALGAALRKIIHEVPTTVGDDGASEAQNEGALATAAKMLAMGILVQNNLLRDDEASDLIKLYNNYLDLINNIYEERRLDPKMEYAMLLRCQANFNTWPKTVQNRYQALEVYYLEEAQMDLGDLGRILTPSESERLRYINLQIKEKSEIRFQYQKLVSASGGTYVLQTVTDDPVPVASALKHKQHKAIKIGHEYAMPKISLQELKTGTEFAQLLAKVPGDKSSLPLWAPISSEDAHIQMLAKKLGEDYEQGVKNIADERAKEAFIVDYFTKNIDQQTQSDLNQKVNVDIKKISGESKNIHETIIKMLNAPPPPGIKRLEHEMALLGKTRRKLTFEDAIDLFLHNDISYYQEKTHLDEKDCAELHHQIYQYLMLATREQHLKRIQAEFEELNKVRGDETLRNECYVKLGKLFAQKREFISNEHPDLLVFEFLDDKLLFKKQVKYLSDLTKQGADPYQVLQLIMGGGKSKVLIPLLASRFADGKHLSMVVVPDGLFDINLLDMKGTH